MLQRHATLRADLRIRPATLEDLCSLQDLGRSSIERLLLPVLRPEQRDTLLEHTPLDPALICDGTYYLAEVGGVVAASGGWSRRAALIRRDGEDPAADSLLEPATDAARIRAMYVHPDFARLGLGSLVLATSEAAARLAGFRRAQLLATPLGRHLYRARGWSEREHVLVGPDQHRGLELVRMEKDL